MDGLVFVGIARRGKKLNPATDVVRSVLTSEGRLVRQREAASLVMLTALERM